MNYVAADSPKKMWRKVYHLSRYEAMWGSGALAPFILILRTKSGWFLASDTGRFALGEKSTSAY